MSHIMKGRYGAAVAVGGVIGANLRYWTSMLLPFDPIQVFPFATLALNLVGACFLGWLTMWLAQRPAMSPLWKLTFGTGLAGALTTFSTFTVETIQLLEAGRWAAALSYQLITLLAGVLAAWMGYRLASYRRDQAASLGMRSDDQ